VIYSQIPKIGRFKEAEAAGRVRSMTDGSIILFKYSLQTVWERDWDDVTMHARGIIFDAGSGEVIAMPFKKFYNSGELGDGDPRSAVPPEGIVGAEVLAKLDGSMGCIFLNRDGELQVSTPGSTQSDQARWATKWLRNLDTYDELLRRFVDGEVRCVVTEIIYPGSKMVVNYGSERSLHVTAVQLPHDDDWRYARHDELETFSEAVGLTPVEIHNFDDFGEIRTMMETVEDIEGFVLHWPDTGYRLKVKCEWYCHLHRTISNIHPNRISDAFMSVALRREKDFYAFYRVAVNTIMEFPEEFRGPYDEALEILNRLYGEYQAEVAEDVAKCQAFLDTEFVGMEMTEKKISSVLAQAIARGEIDIPKARLGRAVSEHRGTSTLNQSRVVNWWKTVRTMTNFGVEDEES